MTPIDKEIIRKRLSIIIDNLKALQGIKEMSLKEYEGDSKELSQKLAPCAGLRNRLVHEYDEIDNSLIFKAVKEADVLFNEYIRQIEKYISEK